MENLVEIFEESEPVYGLIKESLYMFDGYWTKRHKEVITKFHRQILDGTATEEKVAYESEYIKAEPDDYFALLKLVINDDEKEKVDVYSNIYKFIRKNQSLAQTDKIKILRIAKELTFSALKLLPELYVKKNNITQGFTIDKILSDFNSDESSIFEKNQLIQFGLLKSDVPKPNDIITAPKLHFISNFDLYVEAFFSEEELTPEYNKIDIYLSKALVLSNINKLHDSDYIIELLAKAKIKTHICANIKNINSLIFSHTRFIVCLLDEEKIPQDTINDIYNCSLSSRQIVKVSLDVNVIDQLGVINEPLLYLEKGNQDSEDNFIRALTELL